MENESDAVETKEDPEANSSPAPIPFPRRLISVGIIVALLPAFGFFLAYLYEFGVTSIYQIERENIEISVADVAATVLRYGFFVGLIATVVSTANFGFKRTFPSRRRMRLYVLIEFTVLLLVVYISTRGLNMPNPLFAVLTVVVFSVYLSFVYVMGEAPASPQDPTHILARFVDSGYFPIVAAFVVLCAASYWRGLGDAERQESFMVSTVDPSIVVLREYGDRLVAARLIGKNVVDSSSRIYLRAGDVGAKEFERRKLGRLHFEP